MEFKCLMNHIAQKQNSNGIESVPKFGIQNRQCITQHFRHSNCDLVCSLYAAPDSSGVKLVHFVNCDVCLRLVIVVNN